MGTGYCISIVSVAIWITERTGLAMGVITGGTGIGGLAFSILQTDTYNERPDNAPY